MRECRVIDPHRDAVDFFQFDGNGKKIKRKEFCYYISVIFV